MEFDDDEIVPVKNNKNAGGSKANNTTPSKSIHHINFTATTASANTTPITSIIRNITPIGGINPISGSVTTSAARSNSAPKTRALAKAIHESSYTQPKNRSQSQTRSQSNNRRKQRMWENNNLLGLYRYLDVNNESDHMYQSEISQQKNFGLRVDWRSNFYELFRPDNRTLLDSYLRCDSNGSTGIGSSSRAKHNKKLSEEENVAEICWIRLEKRLRAIVIRTLDNLNMCLFVQALESVLMFLIERGIAPPASITPRVLLDMIDSPIYCLGSNIDDDSTVTCAHTNTLVISLKDSSFHRLLLHATAQFYGLRSKSHTLKGERVTAITVPRGCKIANVSLVGYVTRIKKKGIDATAAINVATTTTSATTFASATSHARASFDGNSIVDTTHMIDAISI